MYNGNPFCIKIKDAMTNIVINNDIKTFHKLRLIYQLGVCVMQVSL